MTDDGAAEGNALPLATGELAWLAGEQLVQPEDAGRLLDPGIHLRPGAAPHLEAESHVVEHGHMWVERVGLEDHGHVSVAWRHLVDDLVIDLDLAGGDVFQARQHAQGGRLPAAGGPDQDHELGVLDREAQVIDGGGVGRELLGDVFVSDGRHWQILVDYEASP